MPFKSQAQRAWMHANKPEMAAKWEKHTPKGKKLPKKAHHKESIDFDHESIAERRFEAELDYVLQKLQLEANKCHAAQ